MGAICPDDMWQFGTVGGTRTGLRDPRYYIITGRKGFTPAHIDLGIQTVLYHMVRGVNRFIGVPRAIAAIMWALLEVFNEGDLESAVMALQMRVLAALLEGGKLQYAEVKEGESLLILPCAGHTVLTGDFKIVLAGEWHAKCEEEPYTI